MANTTDWFPGMSEREFALPDDSETHVLFGFGEPGEITIMQHRGNGTTDMVSLTMADLRHILMEAT